MEEKFYYSIDRFEALLLLYIVEIILITIVAVAVPGKGLAVMLNEHLSFLIRALIVIPLAIIALVRLMKMLVKVRDNPVITVTDEKATFSPYVVGNSISILGSGKEISLDFGRMISATILNKRIQIEFRKPNNETDLLFVYLRIIEDSQRLIEILKQHIKFV